MPDAAEALFLSGEIEVKSFRLSVDPVTAALFGYVLVPEDVRSLCLCLFLGEQRDIIVWSS